MRTDERLRLEALMERMRHWPQHGLAPIPWADEIQSLLADAAPAPQEAEPPLCEVCRSPDTVLIPICREHYPKPPRTAHAGGGAMSETGNDETYKARVVAELLERLPTLCVRPDSASRHDVWLLAGELMHTRAALAQLQQERDALLEALRKLAANLRKEGDASYKERAFGIGAARADVRHEVARRLEKLAALATSQKGA